jgi:flagellar hook-associated protein 2
MAGLQLSGLASGFNWSSFIDQMMAVEHAPADQLAAEKATNTQKLASLTTLGSDMLDLQSAAKTLTADGLFDGRTATSDNSSSTWKSTAANSTAIGSYTIAVSQLASAAQRTGTPNISAGLTTSSDVSGLTLASMPTAAPVTAGTFTVNGQQITVALTDSLQDVFDKIATATTGNGDVTASYDSDNDVVNLVSASGSEIVLGAANDTSNFLSVMKLANSGKSTITSSGTLGSASLSSPLANANLRSPITNVDENGNGSFSINGVSIAYNINNDSLSTILTRIGSSTAGVTAAYDAADDQVVLTNKTTGDTGMAVNEGSGGLLDALGLVAGSTSGSTFTHGKNALYTVNGGPTLTSMSNTLDATSHGITGLSVTVNSKSTETISVTGNTDTMKTNIQNFIDAFNTVQTYIDSQTKITSVNGTVSTSLLSDNHEIQGWSQSLRSLAFGSVSGMAGTISSLGDMGIGFTSTEPQLSITDSTKLDDALTNHPDDVAAFFSDTTNGLVSKFNTFFTATIGASTTNIANATTGGDLGTQETNLTDANTSIDTQIADIERRIAQDRDNMTTAFENMETAMSSLKSTQALLTSSYGTTSSTGSIGTATTSSSASTSSTSSSSSTDSTGSTGSTSSTSTS